MRPLNPKTQAGHLYKVVRAVGHLWQPCKIRVNANVRSNPLLTQMGVAHAAGWVASVTARSSALWLLLWKQEACGVPHGLPAPTLDLTSSQETT